MSDENADLQAQEKSAKHMSDENADLQAQEKSAKHMSDENADLIAIKYTFLLRRRAPAGTYLFVSRLHLY
ncbi:MAG: hypothetical protein SPJ45_02810 [Anaerovoracaceae bacterium]|nr:hypothetical protein [Anaerovoracaceae bacterium]